MIPVKCPNCGWVHAAISMEEARAAVDVANAYPAKGTPKRATLFPCLRCFRCGRSSSQFVLAQPGDAPTGSTIQGVTVPWYEHGKPYTEEELRQLRQSDLGNLPRIGTSPVGSHTALVRRTEDIALAVGDLSTDSEAKGDPGWWRLADVLDDVMDVLDALSSGKVAV